METNSSSREQPRRWWWPHKRARSSNQDDTGVHHHHGLILPNFVNDANKLVDILELKEGHAEEDKPSDQERQHIVNELVDARIDSLCSLFRPRHSHPLHQTIAVQHQQQCDGDNGINNRPPIKRRATDLTDDQLANWVLRGACSEKFLTPKKRGKRDKPIAATEDDVCEFGSNRDSSSQKDEDSNKINMEVITVQYHTRREYQRTTAQLLYQTRRRQMLGLPPQQGDATSAQIDQYGRLVRIRNDDGALLNNRRGESANDTNSEDNPDDDLALEDASAPFREDFTAAAAIQHGHGSTGTSRANSMQQQYHLPAAPPIMNQPMRLRDISRQMERDATDAIQRALERYRRQDEEAQQSNNGLVQDDEPTEASESKGYELIHVPLIDPMDDGRNNHSNREDQQQHQQQQQQQNNENVQIIDGHRIHRPQQQNRHPNHANRNQGNNWFDLRLAFRRICYAVITVTAAFIIMMIQGIPLDFGDDIRLDYTSVDSLFLSGLMGPHGHYGRAADSSFGAYQAADRDGVLRGAVQQQWENDDELLEDPSPFAMFRSTSKNAHTSELVGVDCDLSSDLVNSLNAAQSNVELDQYKKWTQGKGIAREHSSGVDEEDQCELIFDDNGVDVGSCADHEVES